VEQQSFSFFNRGPSPAARLVFFSLLSLLLLFVDARYKYLESTRSTLAILSYPLQRLAAAPGILWQQASGFLVLQSRLVNDNEQMSLQHTEDSLQLRQLQVLQLENQHLRDLLEVPHRLALKMQMAEIIYVERDIFKRKIFLNKGTTADVQAGQIVVDDIGVVGQVTRVYPLISEVTLITDKDHAVPVQILRNGLRSVVFGSGDTDNLALRYMPVSSDILEGDVLVTSGIDGTYPPGLPVAKVSHIERDPAYPFARIQCSTAAGVNRQHQLLILSTLPKLPERPQVVEQTHSKKTKHRKGNKS